MADLLDEFWTVMRWHLLVAVVFGVVYGWRAVAVVIAAGLAWCLVLAAIALFGVKPWTLGR